MVVISEDLISFLISVYALRPRIFWALGVGGLLCLGSLAPLGDSQGEGGRFLECWRFEEALRGDCCLGAVSGGDLLLVDLYFLEGEVLQGDFLLGKFRLESLERDRRLKFLLVQLLRG